MGKELLLWLHVHKGAILGIQGGMDAMLGYLKNAQVMCNQDWVGGAYRGLEVEEGEGTTVMGI